MLERVLIPDNILDRLARLEERLADLEAGAVTVQVVETPGGSGNALNGWLATGSAFQDLLGRVVLDASLPGIRLDSGGVIYSADYQAGVSGFKIDGGTAEFNNVVVRGTVYASSGQIGGWSISTSALAGGNATLHSSGYLLLGTGNDIARLDAADTTYRLWVGNATASNAPFRVTKGGALTATNATITGAITATAGAIGGWSISSDRISATNARLISGAANAARLEVGTGTDANTAGVNSPGAAEDIAFWAGATHTNRASAPFRVTAAGTLTATSANITGTINATAGTLSGLTVTGTLTVGSSTPTIQIDGSNKQIQSSNYSTGLVGFRINASGDAEFNNVVLRGALRASSFLYGQILATGGTLVIAKATGRLYADCTTGSTFNVDVADPDGMSHSAAGGLWVVNDIIRLKDPAVGDTWAKITGKTDMTTYWRLSVSLQSGSSGVTFRAGTAVVNYGQSGQGVLWLTADDSNAPFYSVRTHAGSPWSAMTELARLGNLNGNWGYTSATYGIALGEYASNKANLTWDPANGLRLRTYSTTVLQLDNSGNATIAGVLNIGANGGIYQGTGSFSSPQTGLKMWNDSGIGRLATYNGGILQIHLDTDGKLYAGGGKIRLSLDGLDISLQGGWHAIRFYSDASFSTQIARIYRPGTGIGGMQFATPTNRGFNIEHPRACPEFKVVSNFSAVPAEYMSVTSSLSLFNTDVNIGQGTNPKTLKIYGDVFIPYQLGGLSFSLETSPYPGSIVGSNAIGCRVYATTSQNIPHNTVTALSFNTEAEDVGDCWSSSNPTRLVAPVAGYYIFGGEWSLAPNQNPGGFRMWVGALKNGTVRIAANEVHTIANKHASVSVTGSCYLNAGDYIEICAFQDSGSTRSTNVSTDPNYQHMVHGWLRRLA